MIVDPGVQLWGSERALAATLNSLSATWGTVILVTPPGSALSHLVEEQGCQGPLLLEQAPIGYLHKKGWIARIMAMIRLGLLLARYRPHRIYLNQAGLSRLLVPLARMARLPLVIHIRLLEDVARVAPLRGTPGSPIHKIFISDAMLSEEIPWEDACSLVHKAYDPYEFQSSEAKVSSDVAAFVCVGRLSHGKGQHLLVEALALPGVTRAAVHFFGEGVQGDDYADRLMTQAAQLSLGDRVVFQGFRRDVTARLGSYRFLVSTSKYEPLGRVVMEAWEAGLVPIVCSGSGGAAEIVRKSGGGVLYDDWTPASLASALRQALVMPEEARRDLVRAGLEWGKSQLAIERYRADLHTALFNPDSQGKS